MVLSGFLQDLILLGVTALLTGFLVPYILKVIDYRKTVEQKKKEALLTRQSKVLDAQADFLEKLSDILWRWRYLCMKVTYNGGQVSQEKYKAALDEYDNDFWGLLNEMRNQISRSRRLVSEGAYERLLELYEREMVALDNGFTRARYHEDELQRRMAYIQMNRHLYQTVTKQIDEILNDVAVQLKLKGE